MGAVAAALVATGCSDDFLEVDSHTQFPVNEYFSDSAHVAEALVAAYDPLEWTDWANGQYNPVNIMSDIMSDDFWPGGKDRNDNQYWHLMNNFEARQNNCMSGLWTDEYTGVKRCNDVLGYIDGIVLPGATRGAWTTEARILRAYYYNNLWKFYGNIPFFFTNMDAPYFAPQKSADEVYAAVIADLEEALDQSKAKGYLPIKCEDEDESLGRVTQATGYMLYAEMVMYQNDESRYAKALSYMNEIINSGLYGLKKIYARLWVTEGEWCDESIFEIDYSDNKTYRGWNSYEARLTGGTVLPRLISNPGGVGELGIDDGWGFAPVRKEVFAMYDDNDARRNVSALDLSSYNYTPRYEDTGYWLGKYVAYSANVSRASGDKQLNYDNNLRVYRYAETLLNAAELLIRTGQDDGTGKAKEYLNKVRMRAGISNLNKATIDEIINERHKEFVGEGKRYWDLIRTGKAASVLVPDDEGYRTNSWTPSRKYLPIPDVEMSADPNLKQNEGY